MLESCDIGQIDEFVRIVFIRILSMNGFCLCKAESLPTNIDLLIFQANQVHFNTTQLTIVISIMFKFVVLEVAAKFVIDAAEQIEVKVSGDACLIVVSGI
jgi:hypothetical protein